MENCVEKVTKKGFSGAVCLVTINPEILPVCRGVVNIRDNGGGEREETISIHGCTCLLGDNYCLLSKRECRYPRVDDPEKGKATKRKDSLPLGEEVVLRRRVMNSAYRKLVDAGNN